MTPYYLLRSDGSISDIHTDCPIPPESRTDGTWVQGTPPSNSVFYQSPNLLAQLNALFLTLQPSDQGLYFPLTGAIYALVTSGNASEAKTFLSAMSVTDTAKPVLEQMLALL